jgi:hypothetical protein
VTKNSVLSGAVTKVMLVGLLVAAFVFVSMLLLTGIHP